jgi:hypothetical protein
MTHDAYTKRAAFIGKSVEDRDSFKFASPPSVLRALNVYCSAYYGTLAGWDSGPQVLRGLEDKLPPYPQSTSRNTPVFPPTAHSGSSGCQDRDLCTVHKILPKPKERSKSRGCDWSKELCLIVIVLIELKVKYFEMSDI